MCVIADGLQQGRDGGRRRLTRGEAYSFENEGRRGHKVQGQNPGTQQTAQDAVSPEPTTIGKLMTSSVRLGMTIGCNRYPRLRRRLLVNFSSLHVPVDCQEVEVGPFWSAHSTKGMAVHHAELVGIHLVVTNRR
jgi:hypothetical protein